MKKGILLTVALLAFIGAGKCWAQTSELRGLWIDAWHPGFKSSSEVDQLISFAKASNVNAIFIQARRRGDTYYPSSYEPFASDANPSFDALAYTIQKAHSSIPRIEVYFWFVALPIASATTPSDPNHPYNRYPQYLSKDDAGATFGYENYWFDPGNPGAEEYVYDVVMDVVNRYNVDGIQFDYIRFGGSHWGYNDVSVQRFNTAYGRSGQPLYNDTNWSNWRRTQITNLVRKIYANAIAVKPQLKVSAATIPWGSAPSSESAWYSSSAYTSVFQDWRGWMEEGILDLNIPMVYPDCSMLGRLTDWKNWTADHMYNRTAAIGLECSGSACLSQQANIVRQPSSSGNKVSGMSFYSYNCFNGSNYIKLACPTWKPAPVMPWKTAPTMGHIKGSVTYGGAWLDNVTVTLSGPETRSMTADGTGFFAFIDLPPGEYTVAASKGGFGTRSVNASVAAGQVTTADIAFPVGSLTISNVQVTNETSSSVTVTWTTNAGATSQVAYGLDKNCSSLTAEDTNLVTSHSVTVSGLQPLTGYYFKVICHNPETPAASSSVYAFISGALKPDIIIDNPAAVFSGAWSSGTSSTDKYGTDYRYCTAGVTPIRYATYTPNMPVGGSYRVYVWYPAGGNRTSAAPYTINYSGGSQTYSINQQINGGKWNPLATKPFAAGTSGNVTLSNNTSAPTNVMADAVRFEYQSETVAPSVPQNLQAQVISYDQVNLSWSPSTDNAGVAGYRIIRDGNVVGFSYTNSYSDTGLLGNTQYTYSVSALDVNGNKSSNSSSAAAFTLSVPPSASSITCSKPPGVWNTSNPFVFTSVGGFGPGMVAYYSYAWDTNPTHVWDGSEWSWAGGSLSLDAVSGPDPYYLHLRGYNGMGIANGAADLGPYYLDTTAPPAPVVAGVGRYTEPTSITAGVEAQDPESGIADMKYAVGTTSGGSDVVGWTDIPPTDQIVSDGLALTVGQTYYVSVQVKNEAGVWSPVGTSGAITAAQPVATIAALRPLAENTAVILTDKVVSANFGDCVYAQESDRSAGVEVVVSSSSAVAGDTATIAGRWSTAGGMGALISGEVRVTGSGSVSPLGLGTRSIGGVDASSSLPGVTGSYGPYNIGLLVRTFGKVTSVGSGYFILDDGSGAPVKVYSSAPVVTGSTVSVTGIALFETDGGNRIAVVKTAGTADVAAY